MIKILMLHIYSIVKIGAIKMHVFKYHMIKLIMLQAWFKRINGFTLNFTNVDSYKRTT